MDFRTVVAGALPVGGAIGFHRGCRCGVETSHHQNGCAEQDIQTVFSRNVISLRAVVN